MIYKLEERVLFDAALPVDFADVVDGNNSTNQAGNDVSESDVYGHGNYG